MSESLAPACPDAVEHPDLAAIIEIKRMHLDYMARADFKASFFLGCYGVVGAYVLTLVQRTPNDAVHWGYYVIGALDLAALLIGIGFLVGVLLPRMRGAHNAGWWRFFVQPVEGQEKKTPTYFLGILEYDRDEFVSEEIPRLCRDKEYAAKRFASQVYVLAGLCKTKFACVGVGAHLFYVVLFLTFLMAMIRW